MSRISSLVLLWATVLFAAGAVQASEVAALANSGLPAFTFTSKFQGAGGGEIAQDNPKLPTKRVYEFRIKAGTFGLVPSRTDTRLLQNFSELGPEPAGANVASWLQVAAGNLDTMARQARKQGINLVPEDTRIAAVVPLLYTAGDPRLGGQVLGKYNTMGDRADRQVMLAFFDRPCRIEGTWAPRRGAFSVSMDVNIPGPGLHALAWVKESDAPRRYRLELDNSLTELEFVTLF